MTDSTVASERRRPQFSEWRICLALLVIGFALCFGAVKYYRSIGIQPAFYQQNFGPAVMMACGYGFTHPVGRHRLRACRISCSCGCRRFGAKTFPTPSFPSR